MSSYTKPERALAVHFNLKGKLDEQIEQTSYDADVYTVEGEPGEYRVLTSSERDEAIDQARDSWIEEFILPKIPEEYRTYFDCEAWKHNEDCNGSGDEMISSYDGNVHEEVVDGEWYYIIRVN
jgi:hypothetical protein